MEADEAHTTVIRGELSARGVERRRRVEKLRAADAPRQVHLEVDVDVKCGRRLSLDLECWANLQDSENGIGMHASECERRTYPGKESPT